jgi:hypothetical protein
MTPQNERIEELHENVHIDGYLQYVRGTGEVEKMYAKVRRRLGNDSILRAAGLCLGLGFGNDICVYGRAKIALWVHSATPTTLGSIKGTISSSLV